MGSAQRRTLPLFPGVEPAPPKPKRPSIRTLRKRVVETSLTWIDSDLSDLFTNFAAHREAVIALNERLKES